MALIRSLAEPASAAMYIWVETEDHTGDVTPTEHPVESGVNLTDHVKPNAQVLSISGRFVDGGGLSAKQVLNKCKSFRDRGVPVRFVGRQTFKIGIIRSLQETYNSIGGIGFSMEIKQIRIAKSVYKTGMFRGVTKITIRREDGSKQTVNVSGKKQRYHKIKKGQTLSYIAKQYKNRKVTVAALKKLNKNRNVFSGAKGNWKKLKTGASLLLGVW